MRKTGFFIKLKKQGKLELINPSEELKEAHIIKSESNLESAKILLDNGKLEEAVGLAYYSMYNMITALLLKSGIKCENHTASIRLLKSVCGVNNKDALFAKKERIDKQYYTSFQITQEEVTKTAEIFNSKLHDHTMRVGNEDIKQYRKLAEELMTEGSMPRNRGARAVNDAVG